MSDKKRTTVTTIETHEVWIIRRAVPDPFIEAATVLPHETTQPQTGLPSSELDNSSETSEEQES